MRRPSSSPRRCARCIAADARSIPSSRSKPGPATIRSTTASVRCCAWRARACPPRQSPSACTCRRAPCATICPRRSANSASATASKRIDSRGRRDGCERRPSVNGLARAVSGKRLTACATSLRSPLTAHRSPSLKKSDFHYDLPPELIAQEPLPERSASRLMVVDVPAQTFVDRWFRDLGDYLRPGDLLVFNDTRVLPARLYGRKQTGGAVEILIERLTGTHTARAQLGVSKPPKPGSAIRLEDGSALRVTGREGEFYTLQYDGPEPLEKLLLRLGHAPLLEALRARGIEFGYVTLHVGAGTFQPLRSERVEDHVMHREWLNVGAELVEKIRAARARGGRVVAVGTTVVRALESALQDGEVRPFAGETQIFIFPGYRIASIDALITNFHLPESTLLMLVSAFAGRELMLAAYRHAVAQRYRFFSYGDAMLILPAGRA